MADQEHYSSEWLTDCARASASAAAKIVPAIMSMIPVASVVDIGCGLGAFLQTFQAHGVSDVLGVDGSWVPRSRLMIDPAAFRITDLEVPLDLSRVFDLAVCMEVAEHLPESAAEILVASLSRHADVVLFSAAIPFQGGQHHVNERWPSWWAEHWVARGYRAIDVLRDLLWWDESIAVYYRQNVMLFASESAVARSTSLRRGVQPSLLRLDRVHPEMWLGRAKLAAEAIRRLQLLQRTASR